MIYFMLLLDIGMMQYHKLIIGQVQHGQLNLSLRLLFQIIPMIFIMEIISKILIFMKIFLFISIRLDLRLYSIMEAQE